MSPLTDGLAMDLDPIWWRVLEEWRRSGGRADDGVLTLAQMLAWAALSARGQGSDTNFFNVRTLPSLEWEHVLASLACQPPQAIKNAWAFEPDPDVIRHARPGTFERMHDLLMTLIKGFQHELHSTVPAQVLQVLLQQHASERAGPSMLSTEVAVLMARLIDPEPGSSIYCPFDGSAALALRLSETARVFAEIREREASRLLALLAVAGDRDIEIRFNDPVTEPGWREGVALTQFDHGAANPPFGRRYERDAIMFDVYDRFPSRSLFGDVLHIAHLLAQTRRRSVIVVPEGFLFRTSGGERDYKEHLIQRGWLHTVVRLPRGIFAPYTNIQTSLLVFDRSEQRASAGGANHVLFVDATADRFAWSLQAGRRGIKAEGPVVDTIMDIIQARQPSDCSGLASLDQISTNDFNLTVDRYVLSNEGQVTRRLLEQENTIDLEAAAELLRPQALPPADENAAIEFREVAIGDIGPSGFVHEPAKVVAVGESGLSRVKKQRLQPGDILISIKGRVGVVGLVPLPASEESARDTLDWIASQSLLIVRLRKGGPITDPVMLFRYLASPLGQELLKSLGAGTTVPMIQMADMRRLQIVVPSGDEEARILTGFQEIQDLHRKIRELQDAIRQKDESLWPMTLRG